jgi:hypothetical protein
MLLDEGILAVEGERMEVEVEGVPMGQAQRACGLVPLAHEDRITGRIDPATLFSQKRPLGDDIEPGKQG